MKLPRRSMDLLANTDLSRQLRSKGVFGTQRRGRRRLGAAAASVEMRGTVA
jgi:hypothetical protein